MYRLASHKYSNEHSDKDILQRLVCACCTGQSQEKINAHHIYGDAQKRMYRHRRSIAATRGPFILYPVDKAEDGGD